MGIRWKDGYSSDIEIYLDVNGERLRVNQVGRNALLLRDKRELLRGTDARLIIKVDDFVDEEDVVIASDATNDSEFVTYF